MFFQSFLFGSARDKQNNMTYLIKNQTSSAIKKNIKTVIYGKILEEFNLYFNA